MHVRPLNPGDAQAYQRQRLQALREYPSAFSASHEDEAGRSLDEVASRIAPTADGSVHVLGVFEGEELAGFVALIRPLRAKLRHGAELAGMYVAPSMRRHGCGRALLLAAIAQARALDGVRQLKLGVNAANAAAKALYRSAGFERYGTEPGALNIDGVFYDEELYLLRLDRTG